MIHVSEPSQNQVQMLVNLFTSGHYTEAETLARTITRQFPRYGFGWKALGAILKQMGRGADALAPLQKAAQLTPDDAETHNNLGAALREHKQLQAAAASYRRALQLRPDYAQAHANLGNTQWELDLLPEAAHSYQRALQIDPTLDAVRTKLAYLLHVLGDTPLAMQWLKGSLGTDATPEAQRVFVVCAKYLRPTQDDTALRTLLLRGLTTPWGRPGDMTGCATALLKCNPAFSDALLRANQAWPNRLTSTELFGPAGSKVMDSEPLLHALLRAAPNSDLPSERFLTQARQALLSDTLRAVDHPLEAPFPLAFAGALAMQCFINEYVFASTSEEDALTLRLRGMLEDALERNAQPAPMRTLVVAMYVPLSTVRNADRLLAMQWSTDVLRMLQQQIVEPQMERQLRSSVPCLTAIEDTVSRQVQDQYEENPYPRWITLPVNDTATTVNVALGNLFPLTTLLPMRAQTPADILIAGCGTGQQAIECSLRFAQSHVLAVDLSISSLSYAQRKTNEMGLRTIDYAQADLLKLGSLGRQFDVIESCGVLHHLNDPWQGWSVLVSLLRPHGVMKVGLYSEIARRHVVRIRGFIAREGHGSSAAEIKVCRQQLLDVTPAETFGTATRSVDFFSTSTCRDLLFHVQEHRTSLTAIADFLDRNGLRFLGFETDPHVVQAYKKRFPNDPAATHLAQWQVFENENPDVFFNMYQFWVQKAE